MLRALCMEQELYLCDWTLANDWLVSTSTSCTIPNLQPTTQNTNEKLTLNVELYSFCSTIWQTGIQVNVSVIYTRTESRLSVCLLSPLKRRDVRRRNFARGRAPCVCNIWAGSYVDRGHHWGENENFINLRLHFCCGSSKAAAMCCYIYIYRLGRWPSSWLANSMPAKWACRSRLNEHSGWPWPNRRPSRSSLISRGRRCCSEISCNVKWNVYLAMEIPDCVSFISGQNSDDRVRSCEPNVFLA